MKKILFLSLITCIATTAICQENPIQTAVQKAYDEIIPPYKPILDQQHTLLTNVNATWSEIVFTDQEREALRKKPETKEFLRNFYLLEPQAMGIDFCRECLNKKQDPNAQDLETCLEEWLEDEDQRQHSLTNVDQGEKLLNYNNRELKRAFHQGNYKFETLIRSIIQSAENNGNQ